MEIKDKLIEEVQEATMLMQGGHKARATHLIKDAYNLTIENPYLLWDDVENLASLGKLLMVANLFDFYDDEATNIQLAHLSYFILSRALELQNAIIDKAPIDELSHEATLLLSLSKDRVMLVHKCFDSFIPTLVNLLFSGKRELTEEERIVIDKLISNKIPSLVFYDLHNLERFYSNFGDDPYLIEVETEIVSDKRLGQKEYTEGMKLHNLLFEYLNRKIEQDDLHF